VSLPANVCNKVATFHLVILLLPCRSSGETGKALLSQRELMQAVWTVPDMDEGLAENPELTEALCNTPSLLQCLTESPTVSIITFGHHMIPLSNVLMYR
jgi:hypothetical protein